MNQNEITVSTAWTAQNDDDDEYISHETRARRLRRGAPCNVHGMHTSAINVRRI